MGTDCAPLLANLYLYSYESEWITKHCQLKPKPKLLLNHFKSCCRYIHDLLMVNNHNLMDKHIKNIYPKELDLVPDNFDGQSVEFLDLHLTIVDNITTSSLYDKREF